MLSVGRLQAQEEVIVPDGLNTIQEALAAYPGATLVLQRGKDYLTDIPIVISEATTIKGETTPAETRPAVVSFIANPGEGGSGKLFMCAANSILKDFGMMGYTPDDQQIAVLVSAATDSITITLDGCIFQGATAVLEFSGHNDNHYIQKNNIYFNLAGQIWDNWCGFASLWGGANVDFQSYNNTFFICGRVFNAAGTGNNGTEIMNHNSYVNTWGDTFFPIYNDNVSVTNNIFFNSQIRGYVGERTIPYPTGDSLYTWPGDYTDWNKDTYPGLGDDTLCGDIAILANHADSSGAQTRQIFLTNNLKMYDSRVLDFYAANNVTAQTFTNVQNHLDIAAYGWVYEDNMLQEDGNSVDPQFAMGDIPEGAYTNMFKTRQERWLPKSMQSPEFPYENAWRPGGEAKGQFIWPLPFDLKPMNNTIYAAASDGYPLGDLNWFGDEVVAAWEDGLPNPLVVSAVEDLKTSKSLIYVDQNQQLQQVSGMVSIYDVTGRLVIKEYAKTGSIPVGSLKKGIYIVHSNNSATKISIR
jgi:hypothetical protein